MMLGFFGLRGRGRAAGDAKEKKRQRKRGFHSIAPRVSFGQREVSLTLWSLDSTALPNI